MLKYVPPFWLLLVTAGVSGLVSAFMMLLATGLKLGDVVWAGECNPVGVLAERLMVECDGHEQPIDSELTTAYLEAAIVGVKFDIEISVSMVPTVKTAPNIFKTVPLFCSLATKII